ncbi:hypothetical protein NHX12_012252 [Muraenolepis orangiensis]|uniref:PNPLA domain-containing protein n=1 Tax=Muraenolepis orangiensis TaxID=630683 RepID=A0A9Q0DBJ3_9TELE|nr:hypothetical protein NHX12_012252 [Muraenolepis orangiensis]
MSSTFPSGPSEEGPHPVSFSGSGFLATYQLGVAQCLLSRAPWILHAAPLVLGASAGSLVAAAVVCEIKLTTIRDEMLLFSHRVRELPLGPLNPQFNIFKWLEYVLRKHLSSNAHRLANGRLAVAVTRLPGRQNTLVSEFRSKEDVALLCSCFVPCYCGVTPPSIKGVHYMDGGFTSMLPLAAPSRRTLTISPFSGEMMDICPRNEPSICDLMVSGASLKLNQANSLRVFNALYPTDVETLEKAYYSGFKDANHFLQTSGGSMSFTYDDGYAWMDGAAENGSTHNAAPSPKEGLPDLTQMLLFYLSYMSLLGFPDVVSYLLLPLHVPVYYLYLNKEMVKWVFWALLGVLQLNLFLFNVLFHSIQKNVKDRVIPGFVTLQGLHVQAEYQGSVSNERGDWYSSLGLHFTSPGQAVDGDTSVPAVPSTVWLHLECEKEAEQEESSRRHVPRYQSIMG